MTWFNIKKYYWLFQCVAVKIYATSKVFTEIYYHFYVDDNY